MVAILCLLCLRFVDTENTIISREQQETTMLASFPPSPFLLFSHCSLLPYASSGFETGSSYTVQPCLELIILLTHPPKYQDYSHVSFWPPNFYIIYSRELSSERQQARQVLQNMTYTDHSLCVNLRGSKQGHGTHKMNSIS